MALTFNFPSFPVFLSPHQKFLSLKPQLPYSIFLCTRIHRLSAPSAIGPDGKFYPDPSDDDPPEAPEDSGHGVSKFQQIYRQASHARKLEEEDFKNNQSTFLSAIADVEDAPENSDSLDVENSGDDFFGEIDKAIALKRKEFVKQGLLKPNPKKEKSDVKGLEEGIEELEPEEVVDLDEINELQGLTTISEDEDEGSGNFDDEVTELDSRNHGSSFNS